MSDSEVLIRAEHVSKKFCRSLKRSLWYGAQDVARSLMPWKRNPSNDGAEGEVIFQEPCLREDEFWAVRDVSFEVKRGECLGLIGHNGAGKSTLLKMLNSLNRPDSGRITMRGRVGALIELSAGFSPILTGRENVYNQAALLGFSKQETDAKFDEIVEFSELEDFLDTPVQNYSSGMKVRLGFSVAAQMEPDILIIDEVLAVGDVGFRFKCINKMADLMNRAAVIFVTHTMPQVIRVSNSVIYLDKGAVNYQGTDVEKGVSAYYRHFPRQPQTISGAGGVVLKGVRLSSNTSSCGDKGILELEHGGSLEIELELQIQPEISSVVVQVLIWNMEMLPILDAMGSDLSGFPIDNTPNGLVHLKLRLDRLDLNSGTHFLSVIVSSPKLSLHYLRQDNAGVINMMTKAPSGALTITSGEWTVIQ